MAKVSRPHIPKAIQEHLWLRAGGRCEFRGCNKILFEDVVTQDPINESNIAHIISWTENGPRGDKVLSPKLATDINNLMLTCPEHNHLIDSKDNVDKYTVSFLQEMKQEHERAIRELTDLRRELPKRVIELKSMIHGHRPSITEKEEADALFPFYPKAERITIDVCDIEDLETAKSIVCAKVKQHILNNDGDEIFAAFIMAQISLGCYLGYTIGNKIPVKTYQHFRDTEDWKWRAGGGKIVARYPNVSGSSSDVKLFVSISGLIDSKLTDGDYPIYSIEAEKSGFNFLQSWEQVQAFRELYRSTLDQIRQDHGEDVTVHLYPATPNPINFEIGKGIMKNVDPTIILYDKTKEDTMYREVFHLHDRIRMDD